MIRKLAVALLGAGVLVPGLANALGLGEITNSSGLGQPLNAKIELTQTRELQPGEVKVSLASQKDFDAAGVSRDYALTDLVFDVVVKPDGKSYITVRSRRPMNEPYVNFLVEVLWPQGRLLREYTVLLDPPVTSEARRQAVSAPVASTPSSRSSGAASTSTSSTVNYNTSGKPTWKVSRASPGAAKSEPKSAAAPSEAVAAKPAAEPSAAGGEAQYGPTKSNDSLWKIAAKLRPGSDVTVHQTMVALAKYNPDAFIAGNINLLKTGKTLQAPSASQAKEVSSSEAIKEVARQNNAWREMVAGNKEGLKKAIASQQIQGSDAAVSSAPSSTGPDGQLKLAAGETSSAAKSGAGGGGAAIESKLTAAEESLDKSARENQDLKSHVTALQDQVAQSEKVLKLKDDQIAAMQAKMAQLEKEVAEAKSAAAATTPAQAPAPAATSPAQPAQQPDYNYQPQPGAAAPAPAVSATPSPAPEAVKSVPQPVAVPQPQQAAPAVESTKPVADVAKPSESPLSQIPPAVLYGAPAALLVVLLLLLTRKKKEEAEPLPEPSFSMPEPVAEKAESAPVAEPQPAKPETTPAAAAPAVSADPISEADIYIAYRQFPRAIDVLEKAINREPNRADLRLKMLEVLVETGDKSGFERHEAALSGLGDTSAKVRAAELRSTLFGYAAQTAAAEEDDLAFTADESAFDHIEEFAPTETAPASVQDKALDDLGLDFALDLDQTIVQPAAPAPAPAAGEMAPLEFTLDDAFTTTPAAPEAVAEPVVADNALDFDLSFASQPIAEAAADSSGLTLAEAHDMAFEPVAEELGSSLPVLEESHIAEPASAPELTLDLEGIAETEAAPLLSADEPILMPNVAEEAIHEGGDFAFDPMTGEFEPSVRAAQALSAPTAEEAEDLEFLAGSDEISTKLDLARAYIDMGDREGAKDILDEVVVEGDDAQKAEARELLSRLEA